VTKILAVGDVVGKAGRKALVKGLEHARRLYNPNIVIINGENVAGGFGITKKIYDELTKKLAIDCITNGNHWYAKREIYTFLKDAKKLLLPANMKNVESESLGCKVFETSDGTSYAVINLIGNTFMHQDNFNLFETAGRLLDRLPQTVRIRIVDIHAEATSEKQGLAHMLSGKVSLVFGTHSHVPTADERILDQKTGFITDVGLTGSYDSVIGMRKDWAIKRMLTGEKHKLEPAKGDLWFCAIIVDIDEKTGLCTEIKRLRWELNKMDL